MTTTWSTPSMERSFGSSFTAWGTSKMKPLKLAAYRRRNNLYVTISMTISFDAATGVQEVTSRVAVTNRVLTPTVIQVHQLSIRPVLHAVNRPVLIHT